jgi:hypothetical protein
MPDNTSLREKAREAIRTGRLPTKKPDRTFGGPGVGATCALCGENIPRGESEFEIEFRRHGATPGLDRYYLHYRCFAAWEFERAKLDGTDEPPRPAL